MIRPWRAVFIVLVLLTVAGCEHGRAPDAVDIVPPPSVCVERPRRATIAHELQLPGNVVGWQEAKLYAKVSGYLKTVLVDKGDVVRAGQVLASIDSPELAREVAHEHQSYLAAVSHLASDTAEVGKARAESLAADAQYERALARVDEAQAEVLRERSALKLAQATYDRLKQVYDADHGLIARQDLDIAEATLESARAKLFAAEKAVLGARQEIKVQKGQRLAASSQVAAVQARISQSDAQSHAVAEAEKQAQDLLGYTEIRAPFGGTITGRFLDPGALVQSAATTAQGTTLPVLSIANSDVVRVLVQVPQTEVPLVRAGTPIELRADELPGKVLRGRIGRISGALDESTRTMLAECDLPNRHHVLAPGMMVKARLVLESHAHALTVPTTAIVVDGQKHFVYVIGDSKAKKVPITTGFEEPARVEVLSGLNGDEQVIVAGKEAINDGTTVRVTTADAK